MKFLAKVIPFALFLPMVALGAGELTGISTFIDNIVKFINGTLVPAIFALAFLVFLWGMFKTFILGGSDPEKQAEGKQLMIYSVAGFVLMLSLWGIVNLVAGSFGFDAKTIDLPKPAPKN